MDDAFENDLEFGLLLYLGNEFPVNLVLDTVDKWFLFVVGSEIKRNSHVLEHFQSHIRGKLIPVVSSSLPKHLSINRNCQSIEPIFFNKLYDFICVLCILKEVKLHDLESIFIEFWFGDLWYFGCWHHAQPECCFSLSCYLCWKKLTFRSDETLHSKGRNAKGKIYLFAQDSGFEWDVPHVSEYSRVHFDWVKSLRVVFEGDLVVASWKEIAKNLFRKFLFGYLLVVFHFAYEHCQKILLLFWILKPYHWHKLICDKFVKRININ